MNLPPLPANQFWRVTDRPGDFQRVNVVELRQKTWWGSKCIAERYMWRTLSEESIIETAESILAGIRFDARQDALHGDYPGGK